MSIATNIFVHKSEVLSHIFIQKHQKFARCITIWSRRPFLNLAQQPRWNASTFDSENRNADLPAICRIAQFTNLKNNIYNILLF